ncbi:MAG: NYN domain-containing protein [Caldilineaceae bacterium]|nr:NYN domain-containing protein [Caldilineaceae bacterium]
MPPKRAVVYIDGFNLFHGLKDKGWKRYYWLDPCMLACNLLPANPAMLLDQVHYFTAPVLQGRGKDAARRQQIYLDALATLPQLTIHHGKWVNKTIQCRQCGAAWKSPEEKMSDVNIAVQLVVDAYENSFDTAFLVSADSDLTGPIQTVRERFPDKEVRVAFPPKRRSWDLANTAHVQFPIGEKKFRSSQLPTQVTNAHGHVLQRPVTWH